MLLDNRPTLARWAFVICLLCILFLAFIPVPPQVLPFTWGDKIQHAFAFLVLLVLGEQTRWTSRRAWIIWLLLLGAAIELIQGHIWGRDCSFADWVADAIGLTLGLWYLRKHARQRIS